ncbi:MAG TPA: hypothetical protein VFR43_06095 [Gaiellaceae bacterium]|nr:hypothetical protein [Gaiellaceae bacterium]
MPSTATALRPELAAAAGYLGLTRGQLADELRAGTPIARLARARGASTRGLVEVMVAVAGGRLAAAAAAGRLTPAEHDALVDDARDRAERLLADDVVVPFPRRRSRTGLAHAA